MYIQTSVFFSAGQKLIINMWKEKAASPLQILHAGFGIGSFVIPLISNPFLAVPAKETEKNETTTDNLLSTTLPTLEPEPDPEVVYLKESRIQYAYIIAAAITVLVSVIFYIYHISSLKKSRHTNEQDEKQTDDSGAKNISFREMFNPATCANGRFFYGLMLLIFICLYFIQCVGGERVAGKFIRAFSIDHFGFSTDQGSFINTVYWICFSAGRASGFLIAYIVPVRLLILLETFGCLATAILMVIFAGNYDIALWVLTGFMGFFTAPLFPIGIGWGNYHIEMTGVGITIFMMGGSLGGIIYMKLIGHLYDHFGPVSFLYTLLGYGILVFGLAVIMDLVGSTHGSRFKQESNTDAVNTSQVNSDFEKRDSTFDTGL